MKPISMEHAFLYLNWALVKVGHHFPEGQHFSMLFVIKIFIYHSQKVMFPHKYTCTCSLETMGYLVTISEYQ